MNVRRLFRIVRRCLFLLILVAVIAGGVWMGMHLFLSKGYHRDTQSLDGADLAVMDKPDGVTNIALFGVDADFDGARRADCQMIFSLDSRNGKVKVVSLMRDSKVEIDGYGQNKLNHAYSYGGPSLAIRTINRNFDLNIEHFIQVDFSQMANLIGALGGVVIDVKKNEIKELNKFIGEYCRAAGAPECPVEQAGLQTLNGIQAMSYSRIRKGHTGDDWGRVERQGMVLEAMFQRLRGMSASELVQVAPKILKYVTSDLSIGQLAMLAAGMLRHGMPEIEHTRIPADGAWNYGGNHQQYIVFDVQRAAQQLNDYLYKDIPIQE